MAQAVFDEHPLEQYLREAGEGLEIMPGSTCALTQELEPFPLSALTDADDASDDTDNTRGDSECVWRPQFLIYLFHHIETLIATAQLTKPTNPLVERFKYNVISSSLLSPDLPNAHSQTRHLCNTHHRIPGNLSHSRTSSELSQAQQHSIVPTSCPPDAAAKEVQFGLVSGLVIVFAVLLNAGLTRLAILTFWASLAGISYLRVQSHSTRLLDFTPCLQTLDELISTNADWESIIQEVITTIEKDERTVLNSSVSSACSSPVPSLRVALHSTLQTTQTQCDNVRHLLSALTSPSDLSQLSEMYAPPSPLKQSFSFYDSGSTKSSSYYSSRRRRQRPASIPTPPFPSPAMTNFTDHKRMTWNGTHNSTPFSYPSTSPVTQKRRRRHRSDLSTFLGTSASTSASFSAPVTPAPASPLARVSEDIHDDDLDRSFLADSFDQSHDQDEGKGEGEEHGTTSFAAAALKLQHDRTSNGLETLSHPMTSPPSLSPMSSPPRSHPFPQANTFGTYILPLSPRSTFVRSSRFTAIHTSRQPLSVSALRHALQAALGAKRYACAHLLALRFREEDSITVANPTAASMGLCGGSTGITEAEGTYWDDVKSIMELLIGALSDATSRLCEAMREAEAMRLRDQTPTPMGSFDASSGGDVSPDIRKLAVEKVADGRRKRLSELFPSSMGSNGIVSFAPMPSHLSRFAGHVAVVQSALDDARGYLEECVGALKDSDEQSVAHSRPVQSREDDGAEMQDHPALCAYEKLRRELGFALRECERGRNRLLDLVKPQLPDLDHEGEGEGSDAGTPGLGHDSLSEESDKADPVVSPSNSETEVKDNVGVVSCDEGTRAMMDDATRELLLSADAEHLPPAHVNAEQVFEADTSAVSSTPARPKTKLSREERIKLAKARRESGLGLGLGVGLEASPIIHGSDDNGGGYDEKWGPGGDVVQELKDVIWKVGEKRRQVQSQQPAPQQSQPSPSIQPSEGGVQSPSPTSREPSIPSSLDTPGPQSSLDSPVFSPRPKHAVRASMPHPLVRSTHNSMEFSQSRIPRRTSSMNMRTILASLQKEVSEAVGKTEEKGCVLSSE